MTHNEVARQIVDAALRVHKAIGPGLLESVYEAVLSLELQRRRICVARQQEIPILYAGVRIERAFRADLIVEDLVIVEIKSVETAFRVPLHASALPRV